MLNKLQIRQQRQKIKLSYSFRILHFISADIKSEIYTAHTRKMLATMAEK